MSTFKNKNNLRITEAEISEKLKNNEARPTCTGSYILYTELEPKRMRL